MKNDISISEVEKSTIRKLSFRILPFLILCYFIAYIDRVNIGFAALTMNQEIGLTATAFGFGATLFFIAYVIFEIPSNMAMEKLGARIWIARIMITWGIVGCCTAFITGPISYAISRFLL
ncbi:MFS transporter, partial [Acinetobacter baumannii]